MDAAGELAQLGRGLGELLADPVEDGSAAVLGSLTIFRRAIRTSSAERDEPLLRAVVQVALDPAAGRVGGLDDPHARGPQLLRAGALDLLPAQRLLGGAALGDVEQRAVHPQPPARAGHELAAVEHPAHLAVGAHDPVLDRERLLGRRRRGGDRARDTACGRRGWTMLISVRLALATKSTGG